jgi:hypothetical protein
MDRSFSRRSLFALVAIGSLGLGLGASAQAQTGHWVETSNVVFYRDPQEAGMSQNPYQVANQIAIERGSISGSEVYIDPGALGGSDNAAYGFARSKWERTAPWIWASAAVWSMADARRSVTYTRVYSLPNKPWNFSLEIREKWDILEGSGSVNFAGSPVWETSGDRTFTEDQTPESGDDTFVASSTLGIGAYGNSTDSFDSRVAAWLAWWMVETP